MRNIKRILQKYCKKQIFEQTSQIEKEDSGYTLGKEEEIDVQNIRRFARGDKGRDEEFR